MGDTTFDAKRCRVLVMRKNVQQRLELLREKEYVQLRSDENYNDLEINENAVAEIEITAMRFLNALASEKPVFIGDDDIFGFNRYKKRVAKINGRTRLAYGNICPSYEAFLQGGLRGVRERILQRYDSADDKAKAFYDVGLKVLREIECFVEGYRNAALETGHIKLYNALKTVPVQGAGDYYEALVSLHFLQYILRLNANSHIGIGRFDKYMKPYYDASIKAGFTQDDILELTELFFISLNFDSDLYPGVQLGDNGQSLVLGGVDENGNDMDFTLTAICLKASEELKIIDPKINLRVNKNTPLSVYEAATRLTKQGLGFPQYSNDDVVIKGLRALGYDEKDANDYVVAACWEFIIPGGSDFPNIRTMNFPGSVDDATKKHLLDSQTFDEFLCHVKDELLKQIDEIIEDANTTQVQPDAVLSLFLGGCIEKGRDLSDFGTKYNNYGIHGAGISVAADALMAIKKIFEEKPFEKECLLAALENDFKGYEDIQSILISYPKMGNNDDEVDALASWLMDVFSDNLNNKPNNRNGVFRAGTGSAMEYIYQAQKVPATADGRNAYRPFGSSFSPSLSVKINGPLSAVQSFTKYDMSKIINGGPFTIEIHDTVFRNQEGERKVAMLVKSFIDLGGHQIQINSINRDVLLEAQKHPERYPNLIVRVWGWSGYFVELAPKFQNHIIERVEFSL